MSEAMMECQSEVAQRGKMKDASMQGALVAWYHRPRWWAQATANTMKLTGWCLFWCLDRCRVGSRPQISAVASAMLQTCCRSIHVV